MSSGVFIEILLSIPLILFCGLSTPVSALDIQDNKDIKIVSRGDDNARYAIDMIQLALQKTLSPIKLSVRQDALSAPKLREDLLEGDIDIIWTATNMDMEERALPVRIPLFKGLLGHRILIIHKDRQHLFDKVTTMGQAKQFTYGQGKGWTDTMILQHNGLTVIQAVKYEGLFHMTDGGRFDAYPRGVHEPWGEITSRPDLALSVDKNLMFVYTMPYYLFVTPKRPQLASTIERGLNEAIDDGSFDSLFLNNPMVKMVIKKANLSQRRIFKLQNPELPPLTPLDDPRLWINVSSIL